MQSLQEKLKSIKSEELLQRFRSKDDLYRYITTSMGLYMPTQKGTKISFLRAIFCNQKKALKQADVFQLVVPHFEELSVKNLYKDVMNDSLLRNYLPELEQNSNRYPEREFFFGILGTLRPQYLNQIIGDANKVRYEADPKDPQKDFIMLDDDWYKELMKYPYFSSKNIGIVFNVQYIEKPGKAIFLMKQRSKLIRAPRKSKKHAVSQRLSGQGGSQEESKMEGQVSEQRRKTMASSQQTNSQPPSRSSKERAMLDITMT